MNKRDNWIWKPMKKYLTIGDETSSCTDPDLINFFYKLTEV